MTERRTPNRVIEEYQVQRGYHDQVFYSDSDYFDDDSAKMQASFRYESDRKWGWVPADAVRGFVSLSTRKTTLTEDGSRPWGAWQEIDSAHFPETKPEKTS